MNHNPCKVCNSDHTITIDSYKHHCILCYSCKSVSHIKKEPNIRNTSPFIQLLFKLLPEKLFLKLFSAPLGYVPASFYKVYVNEALNLNSIRKSEPSLLLDQLTLAGIDISGKSVLDLSGGPGYVGSYLDKELSCDVTVTEYSHEAASAMRSVYDIKSVAYDYNNQNIESVLPGQRFDVILFRSSLIFCSDIDDILGQLKQALNSTGFILVETIVPTMGELLWWQCMEFKFPSIYSEETIRDKFTAHGFLPILSYKERGSYFLNKLRSPYRVLKHLFTWLFEFPLLLFYYTKSINANIPIDRSLDHYMLYQVWQKGASPVSECDLGTFVIGKISKPFSKPALSPHFNFKYNRYLTSMTNPVKS